MEQANENPKGLNVDDIFACNENYEDFDDYEDCEDLDALDDCYDVEIWDEYFYEDKIYKNKKYQF